MSPIKHVRDLVGRHLTRDPRSAASKDELLLLIQATWNSLPHADIQKLIDSMPPHIVTLIAARGGYTKYHKDIEYLVLKSRKRLNILKYIARKSWCADAATLRLSSLTLIRPILEYGFPIPIYCCASNSALKKLEKVQLSAARIITGLKPSCPSNIVLFEADLQPLLVLRKAGLVKYFNKLSSFGQRNQTYLKNWISRQRLKKNSPFSQDEAQNFLTGEAEPSSLQCNFNPLEEL
ncbi:reverse transcriptase domain-containing protein [Trichonephila clavipes]|nr:reverse transcriptase domain-containing protein [Trichonephila clavipes]